MLRLKPDVNPPATTMPARLLPPCLALVALLFTACDESALVSLSSDPTAAAVVIEPMRLSEAEWRERLTPDQFQVLRQHGTEAPYCSPWSSTPAGEGVYACAGCGLPLFATTHQYDSGTGWPSFDRPVHPGHLSAHLDRRYGMTRTEVRCARCDGHLGHVFPDGPRATTGRRYCINSAALTFVPADEVPPDPI
jgi:peptide-methionine (R)-S-oxide reductase